jgi:hypothetical protein
MQPSVVAHFGGIEDTHEACSDRALNKVVERAVERVNEAAAAAHKDKGQAGPEEPPT